MAAEVLNCDKKIRQIVSIWKNAPIFAPSNDKSEYEQ